MNSLQTVWQGTGERMGMRRHGPHERPLLWRENEDALAGFLADEGAATDAAG